jgi:hypothetical protein
MEARKNQKRNKAGTVLTVEGILRCYIADDPPNGDSDEEAATPLFGGRDDFVEFLEESDGVVYSFRDCRDHPVLNNV